MYQQNHLIGAKDIGQNRKKFYRLAGGAAIIALMVTLLDITLTFIPGWSTSTVPENAADWFVQFQNNGLLGLRNLDLLNVIISIITIPMFCALYVVHRDEQKEYGLLAMMLFILGTAIFISNNIALPMLDLSSKYAAATSELQKTYITAAGEAMLARGEHGSPGAFMGFFLSTIASINIALVMLRGKIFSKATAYVGITGFILLLIYTVFTTFVPSSINIVMIIAMPGGLLAVAWNIMVARKLLELGKKESTEKERSLEI